MESSTILKNYTLLDYISDGENAINNGSYLSALSLALTIPDICGKKEFPNEENNKKRYIDWFDSYIGKFQYPPIKDGDKLPYLSGNLVYQLRCAFLHNGDADLNKTKLGFDLNDFFLHLYYDESFGFQSLVINESYTVSINEICSLIFNIAKGYYNDNKEKFKNLDIYVVN